MTVIFPVAGTAICILSLMYDYAAAHILTVESRPGVFCVSRLQAQLNQQSGRTHV